MNKPIAVVVGDTFFNGKTRYKVTKVVGEGVFKMVGSTGAEFDGDLAKLLRANYVHEPAQKTASESQTKAKAAAKPPSKPAKSAKAVEPPAKEKQPAKTAPKPAKAVKEPAKKKPAEKPEEAKATKEDPPKKKVGDDSKGSTKNVAEICQYEAELLEDVGFNGGKSDILIRKGTKGFVFRSNGDYVFETVRTKSGNIYSVDVKPSQVKVLKVS